MRFVLCLLCGVLLGCSTQHRDIGARQTNPPPFYLFWGAEDGSSAYRFLSARIRLNEEIRLGGDYFLDLTGHIKQRGNNLVADLLGSTGQEGQLYRGAMTLEKPVFAQGGASSGGVGPRCWFLLATNGDCRRVLERVNAILGLTGQPFNHPGGLTNGPFYHPVANAASPASSTIPNVDPATGLPWGNRVVDPVTGLPLSPGRKKASGLPFAENLLDAVNKPADRQDTFIKAEAHKLAESQVPTREDAEKLALSAFIKRPGLDARENCRVTGLYRIGRDVPGFAKEGELVWEIRVSRLVAGVSGIVWVSTTTKGVKVLFPVEP